MFFMILGTYRNQTFIDFSPAQRIQLKIFLCHTVTHGTDLRRSPQETKYQMLLSLGHSTGILSRIS